MDRAYLGGSSLWNNIEHLAVRGQSQAGNERCESTQSRTSESIVLQHTLPSHPPSPPLPRKPFRHRDNLHFVSDINTQSPLSIHAGKRGNRKFHGSNTFHIVRLVRPDQFHLAEFPLWGVEGRGSLVKVPWEMFTIPLHPKIHQLWAHSHDYVCGALSLRFREEERPLQKCQKNIIESLCVSNARASPTFEFSSSHTTHPRGNSIKEYRCD
ncbi:hypothetical protein M011DRAFT_105173 [Sporormia fimetaria CBS 119925]|uniref:Uncharacterized protein n=1 Tax=Sporormia fimetaria CBS 119925 TaxID=1340428 RepID=A0A6A6VN85_9PLEO|nr:hypothetical protein M011DRAFT_105173 [Sporormia fimetaria CBS 119925]